MNNPLRFWSYVKTAFNAKLPGMFVSPNWLMVAAFSFLGIFINPGFILIGAGLELSYLFVMVSNPHFQNIVQSRLKGEILRQEQGDQQERLGRVISTLPLEERKRFSELKNRCYAIIEFYQNQVSPDPDIIQRNQNSLNKLSWIFLQLLSYKQTLIKLTQGTLFSKVRSGFEEKIREIENTLTSGKAANELKKSLESKLEILKSRFSALNEAENKRLYIESELDRIEQQIELIKDQAVLSRDPQSMAISIDSISTSLGETSEWMKQQEAVLGPLQEVIMPSPAIITTKKEKPESQGQE